MPTLSYRVGTHGGFLHRMLARIPLATVEWVPGQPSRPLANLTTRLPDDPAIALLDAWAVVGDVLTFYQERIANEGFLRTATERRSILELARLIGYELSPGVAASAFLTFLVDTADGAPTTVVVPQSTRGQSVPGQGELPQTFQTSRDLSARREWNTLQPRGMRPQRLALSGGGKLHLLGVGADSLPAANTFPLDLDASLPASGSISATEVDTIFVTGTATNLSPGDVLLFVGRQSGQTQTETLVKIVRAIEEEAALGRTRVELDADAPAAAIAGFGDFGAASADIAHVALNAQSVDNLVVSQTWSDSGLSAWLAVQGWDASSTLSYIYGAYTEPTPPPAAPSDPGTFAMRTRLGFFGHNAPAFGSLTAAAQAPFVNWDQAMSVWKDSLQASVANGSPAYYDDGDCFLERSVAGLTGDGWAVFERPTKQFTAFRVTAAPESSAVGYSLSAKTTGLVLAAASDGTALQNNTSDKPETFNVRKTTAHVRSERLTLAQLPIEDPLGAGTAEAMQLTLDRMVLNLAEGQPIAVTGERDDLPGVVVSEVVILDKVEHAGGFTTLLFTAPGLTFRYVRSTVTLCANVVEATHGESVHEVLGSGDATTPNQRFALKKPPLTHVASAGAAGTATSLEVRIDGVAWSEVPRLHGLRPSDESYLVRHADDGTVTVVFGDGVQGARLPTGVENVTAAYRSGIGAAGMVRAGSLTLLMTQPLGIRNVTNPLAASGAADPEQRDDARRNAPLTVLAMERVVSLQDAEDFTRAFAGVGKCAATAVWRRGRQWIHLTVAAAAPKPEPGGLATGMADHRIDATAPLWTNLDVALRTASEPSLNLRLDTYQPVFFNLSAKVLIDARYRWEDVEAAARSALRTTYSFEGRSFAQPVSVSDVITTIQRVPGVVFVDLDSLHRFDQPATLPINNLLRRRPDHVGRRRTRTVEARATVARQPAGSRSRPGACGGRGMTDRSLIDLLPAVYRVRDRAQGGALEALLDIIGEEARRVEVDVDAMYDDWFIETCREWVVPYIGDLLGVRSLLPIDDPAFTQRAYVANTLGYRRRKGTVGVLEQLARDLTGWPARAVEYFERLVTTQHANHVRLHAMATADVRDAHALAYASTPFETVTHTAEVRHIDNARGRYGIANVGLHMWRLQTYPVPGVTARQVDATRFTVDPLGGVTTLFNIPDSASSLVGPIAPRNFPMPLSRRILDHDIAHYYGDADDPASVVVSVGGAVTPRSQIVVCDLSDAGGGWAHTPSSGVVALDPQLGRIAFGDAPNSAVATSHAYGFAGDLGGGPYDKRASLVPFLEGTTWQHGVMGDPPAGEDRIKPTLVDAVKTWNQQPPGSRGVIVLMESTTLEEDLKTQATRIRIPEGSQLVIVAGGWPEEDTDDPSLPLARLTGRVTPREVRTHLKGTIEVVGTAPAESAEPGTLVLVGLLIEGTLTVKAGNLGPAHLSHCTLAPSAATFKCEDNAALALRIERSIVGTLAVGSAAPRLTIAASIVDGDVTARDLSVDSSTVLGAVGAQTLEATSSILNGVVTVERRQVGCVRFSYLPTSSKSPRRFRCQPADGATVAPAFVSTDFGHPGLAMLRSGCPPEIAEGGEGETEMGAWRFLHAPRRLRNLRLALDEYLRFGMEAGVFLAEQRPAST